jgi:predicted glycoside hydrolase/deacetylase ChbG (UPF0249 family)
VRVVIHADDLGLTQGITDNIMASCMQGAVRSVSLVVNGLDTHRAIEFVREQPQLLWSVHINLVEGRPISNAGEVALLVDKQGYFKYSFMSLWFTYLTCHQKRRNMLKEQVCAEINAQLKVAGEWSGCDHIRVDGHQHAHMIPFVFDALMTCGRNFQISYVRLPRENLYLVNFLDLFDFSFVVNFLKNRLLNYLCKRALTKLRDRGIQVPSRLVGVLYTGRMTAARALQGLKANRPRATEQQNTEVLFHPGGFHKGEEQLWLTHTGFRLFYLNKWRRRELETLLGEDFRRLLLNWNESSEGKPA